MMKTQYLLASAMLFLFLPAFAQKPADTLIIVSYNVENFFDTKDDSLKNDEQFLPEGSYHWNTTKYRKKQASLAKVIASVGGWNTPAIVGLCEIENEKVLRDFTRYSPLKNLRYKYIHKESPDARGIDVALLYQPDMFEPLKEEFIQIDFPGNPYSKTRDILYTVGKLPNQDTLHVFMVHAPSRYGGQAVSEPRRIYVASVLRAKADSILAQQPKANILMMGDFNDYPGDKSINSTLGAVKPSDTVLPNELYNLYYSYYETGSMGSHKFQGNWGMLDQMMVSGNLITPSSKTFTDKDKAQIYDADFLLEDDAVHMGKKPFRTYNGMRYNGGYADHLPIFIKLILKE